MTPKAYFRLHGKRPRKSFGQHFLSQPATAQKIIACAHLDPSEVVVEVGPGLGALTRYILPAVRFAHLVELDRDLASYLERAVEAYRGKVRIHRQDILAFDFEALSKAEQRQLVVLGNLPFSISSPLIFRLLEAHGSIKRAVFMVQKEVGERLAAGPGGKDYGVLSVLLGLYAEVSRLFSVGPAQFYPPPKVESLVIRIDFRSRPPSAIVSFAFLKKLVNSAFQQRRKTLQNSLKSFFGGDPHVSSRIFKESGIDPKRRPESLHPEEFLRLAAAALRETERPYQTG